MGCHHNQPSCTTVLQFLHSSHHLIQCWFISAYSDVRKRLHEARNIQYQMDGGVSDCPRHRSRMHLNIEMYLHKNAEDRENVQSITNKLCAWRHNMPPLQVDNIFVFIREVAPFPACWLSKTSATS